MSDYEYESVDMHIRCKADLAAQEPDDKPIG